MKPLNLAGSSLLILTVGEPHPEVSPPLAEGVGISLSRHDLLLRLVLEQPRPTEIQALRSKPLEVALVPIGPHTLAFLVRCPGGLRWSDVFFAAGLVPPPLRGLPYRQANQGLLLRFEMLDTLGIIHALRAVTLSPRFCTALERLVQGQVAASSSFEPAIHQAAVEAAIKRWPRAKAMLEHSIARERAGMPF